MRITAFRTWVRNAVQHGASAAKKIGHAISHKVRSATGAVEAGVGVGEDENEFGGRRSRVWFEILEEARKKLLDIFEKSYFERFPRLERLVRRFLGGSTKQQAPKMLPKRATGPVKLGAHTPDRAGAEAYKKEISDRMMKAHVQEHAGLRDDIEESRSGPRGRATSQTSGEPPGFADDHS